MCTEGVMHWTALHETALTHTSSVCRPYTPGHELKAVAARHIHPFFRKAMEAMLSCFKMHHSKPVKSTHCKMVLVWDGVKEHMQGLWEKMRCLNIIQRGTHLWPAVALPEQMTVGQISLNHPRVHLSEISRYWHHLFQSQIWSSVSG